MSRPWCAINQAQGSTFSTLTFKEISHAKDEMDVGLCASAVC
jgi:hypothetical protein